MPCARGAEEAESRGLLPRILQELFQRFEGMKTTLRVPYVVYT